VSMWLSIPMASAVKFFTSSAVVSRFGALELRRVSRKMLMVSRVLLAVTLMRFLPTNFISEHFIACASPNVLSI